MTITPNTLSETEAWLESLGSTLVDVQLYVRPFGGSIQSRVWLDERHINDPETLLTTVSMSLQRLGGRFAIWQNGLQWELFDMSKVGTKLYPNREAAEMSAMHRG